MDEGDEAVTLPMLFMCDVYFRVHALFMGSSEARQRRLAGGTTLRSVF